MANLNQIPILFIGLLSLLSFSATVRSEDSSLFIVEGEVYCEVCRTNFINKLSEPMSGAIVSLQCKGEEKGNVTYTLEGNTDANGKYRMVAEGDHSDEECEVTLVKSSRPDCSEVPDEGWAIKPSARITITTNSGFHDNVRQANPLGFTKKVADAGCEALLKELKINPNDL